MKRTLRKVKFGIIGTGAIAHKHAEALALTDNAELIMVYDRDRQRAESFAAQYNCRAAADFERFLASEVEAVTIAVPSGLHGQVAIPAACAGKHILCEKPLEVTSVKSEDMIRSCEDNRVLLSAVFQSRFSHSAQLIKKAVDIGRFGQPVLGTASVRWYRTPEYYDQASWRGTRELDGGGALMNQGIHTVDLLLYFNGDVDQVIGKTTRRLHHSIEVEDTVVAMLKFKNGSLGSIEASTACAPGFPRRVELSGTEGSVILEGDRIIRWQFSKEMEGDEEIRRNGSADADAPGGAGDPNAISCEGHRRQIEELATAILQGEMLTIPGREGKRSVDLICAIYESDLSGKVVELHQPC